MKVKLGNVVASKEGLKALQMQPLNIVTAFQLAKTIRLIDVELASYEKARTAKVMEHGVENADKSWSVSKENEPKFYEELGLLLDTEIELDLKPIPLNTLKTASGDLVDVATADVIHLDWLITM